MENVGNFITEEIKFHVLTDVCSFINSEMPYEQQLQAIVEAANKLIGVRDSSLIIFDEQTQLLHFNIVTGEKSQELKKMTMMPGEGIAAKDQRCALSAWDRSGTSGGAGSASNEEAWGSFRAGSFGVNQAPSVTMISPGCPSSPSSRMRRSASCSTMAMLVSR